MSAWLAVPITVAAVVVGGTLWLILLTVGDARWGWMAKADRFLDWADRLGRKLARRP